MLWCTSGWFASLNGDISGHEFLPTSAKISDVIFADVGKNLGSESSDRH